MEEKIKVLLVDDEPEILKIVGNYFSFFDNVEIVLASGYFEAEKLIGSESPRIMITDVNLPDGNGLELVRRLRKASIANQAIVITGENDLNLVLDAMDVGAIDYLKKPFDLETLKTVVFEAVNRYRRWYDVIRLEIKAINKF